MCAEPPDVLEALIDPEFMSLWAPVDLEVDGVVLSVTPAAGAPIGKAAISTGTWAVTAH